MHIRDIVNSLEIDLDEYRISYEKYDFEKRSCDFKFELPEENWLPWEICLPDTDHNVVYKNMQKHQPQFLEAMLEMIHQNVPESKVYDDAIVITVFSVLHEIGHLWNYIKKGMNKCEYIQEEQADRESILKLTEFVPKFVAYRNLPNEKAADAMAFDCLVDVLNKIIN